MIAKDLIEQHKIYLEDLERWVVPLEVVEQALKLKAASEIEGNIKQLDTSLEELTKVFNELSNIKLNG